MSESKVDPRFYTFRDAARSDLQVAADMLADDPKIIRLRNGIGETALHFLAVENCLAEVDWLIEHGSEVDTQNEFRQTPLMEAASLGLLDMCKVLISRGANFRYVSAQGESVFSAAAAADRVEVLQHLLKLLPPQEDINSFFDNVDAAMTMEHSPNCAFLLMRRGLTKRGT
ncbi:MAG: ankyrin repeat domain-containing protein [Chthoniobacter sp.]|uniref:ankyrin repeat domain-containing protein n=1 Tax=Chthoniobacter sp. TaxID=2510640 RepID=UPI0032AC04F7